MTNEEAKEIIECREMIDAMSERANEALDRAIKALEQGSIIDKIRTEIVELRSRQNVGVLECLDIIDKYNAESEEQE